MKILQLDNVTGEILKEYKTLTEAAKAVGRSSSAIRGACVWSYKGQTSGGYRWIAINEKTNLNHYEYGNHLSKTREHLSIEEINDAVAKRREEAAQRRQRCYDNRARSFNIKCNKCNSSGKINNATTLKVLKARDDIELKATESGSIVITCTGCDTLIEIK